MKKYGRQQRQLGALIRFYRRHTPGYLSIMRNPPALGYDASVDTWRKSKELTALESRLPPEMVAWARLNR